MESFCWCREGFLEESRLRLAQWAVFCYVDRDDLGMWPRGEFRRSKF